MIENTKFQKKSELSEYEVKLKQLEQNLRGLSNTIETEEPQIKHRSFSRETQEPALRRILKLEERLTIQEARSDDYEIKVKKIVEHMCTQFDSQPWLDVVDNVRIGVEGKITQMKDQFSFIQNEMESKFDQFFKIINEKQNELKHTIRQINSDQDDLQSLFEMIKKCIDSQQSMVNEFKQFKINVKQQINDIKDDKPLKNSRADQDFDQENKAPSLSYHQRVYSTGKIAPTSTVNKELKDHNLRQILKTQEDWQIMRDDRQSMHEDRKRSQESRLKSQEDRHIMKAHLNRQILRTQEQESERDYLQSSETSKTKSRKSYNELKEQDFDQMRRASYKDEAMDSPWQKSIKISNDKQKLSLAKQSIDNEINFRLLKEDNERKTLIEKDKKKQSSANRTKSKLIY